MGGKYKSVTKFASGLLHGSPDANGLLLGAPSANGPPPVRPMPVVSLGYVFSSPDANGHPVASPDDNGHLHGVATLQSARNRNRGDRPHMEWVAIRVIK